MGSALKFSEFCTKADSIKNSIGHIDYLYNVIFIDSYCFYTFLGNVPASESKSIKDILEELEDYIPMGISEEAADIFLECTKIDDKNKSEELYEKFLLQCRLDFLYLAYNATDLEWENIKDSCRMFFN